MTVHLVHPTKTTRDGTAPDAKVIPALMCSTYISSRISYTDDPEKATCKRCLKQRSAPSVLGKTIKCEADPRLLLAEVPVADSANRLAVEFAVADVEYVYVVEAYKSTRYFVVANGREFSPVFKTLTPAEQKFIRKECTHRIKG